MSKSDTPRTEYNKYESWKYYSDPYCVDASFAEELERELTAVTEQRDRLAELLSDAYPFVRRWHGAMDSVKIPLIKKIEGYFRETEALQSLTTNEQ
jgi:hypothetical protein